MTPTICISRVKLMFIFAHFSIYVSQLDEQTWGPIWSQLFVSVVKLALDSASCPIMQLYVCVCV